jgi:hypothetical protein
MEAACDLVGQLGDPAAQLQLLRHCLDACKVSFLLRGMDTSFCSQQLARCRTTLQNTLGDIMGCGRVPERQWAQATLPLRLGGLGIKDPVQTAASARVAAILGYLDSGAKAGLKIALLRPAPDLHHCLQEIVRWTGQDSEPAQSWLKGGVPRIEPDHLKQKWWSSQVAEARRRALPEGCPLRDKCRLALQGMPHSSAWLGLTPNKGTSDKMSGSEFQLVLRWWLGLPVLPSTRPLQCPLCGGVADIFGDHFLCCKKGLITKRHHHVRDTLAALLREGGFAAEVEMTIGDRLRPADIALQGFEARPMAIDLTICHPLQPSETRNVEQVKSHLTQREERKINKYIATTARAGWVFHPAAFHPWGGQGPLCSTLLDKVVRRIASPLQGRERSQYIDSFWQRLGQSLMKGIAEQLAQALHCRGSPSEDPADSMVGGPVTCLLHRTDPLVDDYGNLLPEALPEAPRANSGWEAQEGPMEECDFRLGPIRVRVRPRADAMPLD